MFTRYEVYLGLVKLVLVLKDIVRIIYCIYAMELGICSVVVTKIVRREDLFNCSILNLLFLDIKKN